MAANASETGFIWLWFLKKIGKGIGATSINLRDGDCLFQAGEQQDR